MRCLPWQCPPSRRWIAPGGMCHVAPQCLGLHAARAQQQKRLRCTGLTQPEAAATALAGPAAGEPELHAAQGAAALPGTCHRAHASAGAD